MDNAVCKVEKLENAAILSLVFDNLLVEDNEKIKKTVNDLIDGGVKNIILDLSGSSYVSSLILASLVYMLKRTKDAGGNLVICSVTARVKEILSVTNLDKIFDIALDRPGAMKLLGLG